MPRNVTVTLENGQTVTYQNVPDTVTPDQVSAKVQQEYGQAPKVIDGGQPESEWSLRGLFDDGARGLGKAVMGTGDLLRSGFKGIVQSQRDMRKYGMNPETGKINYPEGVQPEMPLDFRWSNKVEEQIPTPPTQSGARRYTRAGVEGLGGALISGPKSAINLISGVTGGLGGQFAEEHFKDNPLAKLLGVLTGGLAGGGVTAKVTGARVQAQELAREAMEGLDPAMLKRAQAFQAAQAARGVQIDLAQALEATGAPASNLTTIRNVLANKSQGTNVQRVLRNQPAQIAAETENTVAALPGQNYGMSQSSNNLQEAATGAVEAAKRARSAEVRGLYEKAGDLTTQQRDDLIRVAEEFANRPGAVSSLKAEVAKFAAKLRGQADLDPGQATALQKAVQTAASPLERARAQQALADFNRKLAEAGAKPTRALDVDTAIAELVGPYKGSPLSPPDPKALGQVKGLGKALNERFQAASPEVAAAEQRFRQITEETINPLKQSSVGTMATPRGYKPDVQASMTKFDALMNAGRDPTAKVSDIRTLATGLARQDPQAFGDAFKSWVSGKVQSVMKPGVDDVLTTDPSLAAKLDQTVFGSTKQWNGIKDAMVVQAELAGQNPAEVLRGMDNLRRLVRGAASRPQSVGGLSYKDTVEIAGKSKLADSARIFGFLPFEKVARRVEDAAMGKTFRQFDEILTTPEGAQVLAELSKVPVMSRKAQSLLGTFFGGYASTQGEPQSPGNTGQ